MIRWVLHPITHARETHIFSADTTRQFAINIHIYLLKMRNNTFLTSSEMSENQLHIGELQDVSLKHVNYAETSVFLLLYQICLQSLTNCHNIYCFLWKSIDHFQAFPSAVIICISPSINNPAVILRHASIEEHFQD